MLEIIVASHFCIIDLTIAAKEPQSISSALAADQYLLYGVSVLKLPFLFRLPHDRWRY